MRTRNLFWQCFRIVYKHNKDLILILYNDLILFSNDLTYTKFEAGQIYSVISSLFNSIFFNPIVLLLSSKILYFPGPVSARFCLSVLGIKLKPLFRLGGDLP